MHNLFKFPHFTQIGARKSFIIFILALVFIIIFLVSLPFSFKKKVVKVENPVPLYLSIKSNSNDIIQRQIKNDTANSQIVEMTDFKSTILYKTKIETIKVESKLTNEVLEMALDDYVACVILAEMPQSFDFEALKAQAVASRTYAIHNIETNEKKHELADVCTDYRCCQAFINKDNFIEKYKENGVTAFETAESAAKATSGIVMLYDGEPIQAFFHATSGYSTYASEDVWGKKLDYLRPVKAVENLENLNDFISEQSFSKKDFLALLESVKKINLSDFYSKPLSDFVETPNYNDFGLVTSLKIGNTVFNGNQLRSILKLRSASFEIKIDDEQITFICKGYGHGVGMSQNGANILAKQGYNFMDILKYYYCGIYFGFV